MLRFVKGNLFESKAQTLVNTVNCRGVMGKGVAFEFKKRFPEMYEDYRKNCKQSKVQLGELTFYDNTTPWVINFPTKYHWKSNSKLNDIETGLKELVRNYKDWEITSLAMPALGCGHGGLDWGDVRPLIEQHLGDLDIDIEVYEPGSKIEEPEEPQYYKENLFGDPVTQKKSKQRK